MSKHALYIFALLASLLLAACSAERNNPLSKAYHNTTAHYNGYFLAKEKLNAIELAIQQQTVYDYNRPLPIFPPIDSTVYKAHAAELEDIIKKASFPIQYHPNSKWIDDSYLVIGKVRFYELNFPEAAQTFRYVNSTGKDRHVKHEALVWLMRTFMQMNEIDNAWQVSEYLRKERLNRDNARNLYLARAQYHLMQGDTAAVIENLDLSLPNFSKRDDQSRVRFSLARLYQERGQNKEAYQQYSRILRRNPPYDLGFFSRLYLGQVSELDDAQDLNRIAGYYQRMLRDEKNTEYRDKIYYEMAVFERRQQHYDKALEHIAQSLKTSGSIPNQKAYTYLLAGEVYFEDLNKYNLAQAYYDSAVQVYPQQAIEYEQVMERRNILADFAKQYTTIQTQDSLQQLARMPEAERLAFVEQVVQREEEMRLQAQARQLEQEKQRRARRSQEQQAAVTVGGANNPMASAGGAGSGVFYFDNPTAMATARSEFVRRWGDRPLQDNWRQLSRGETLGGQEEPVAMEQATDEPETESEENRSARLQTQVQTYLQNVPVTTLAIQQSEKMVEDALYRLGNIYAQKLNSPQEAIDTYGQYLERFPQAEHADEVHYSLFLLYGRMGMPEKDTYYTRIKQQYPNTIYAKLVDDPNYMSQNALDNIKAHTLYDSAYAQYETGEYQQANTLLTELRQRYPLNDIPDKVAFLQVMITARSERPELLREQLQAFKYQYPSSPLAPRADELLSRYQELEQKQQLRQEAPAPPTARQVDDRTPEQRVNNNIALASARERNAAQQSLQTTPAIPAIVPNTPAASQADTTAITKPGTPLASDTLGQQTDIAPPVAPAPAADPLAYSNTPDTAYYYVMLYPGEHAAFKDIEAKYEKYNNTYFRNQKLQVEQPAFGTGQTAILVRAFSNMKEAQAYTIKQKAPQSPIGKIRGVEFTTFAISSENWVRLTQKQDIEEYLNYFRTNN